MDNKSNNIKGCKGPRLAVIQHLNSKVYNNRYITTQPVLRLDGWQPGEQRDKFKWTCIVCSD